MGGRQPESGKIDYSAAPAASARENGFHFFVLWKIRI
jgi:hypothetical protein